MFFLVVVFVELCCVCWAVVVFFELLCLLSCCCVC